MSEPLVGALITPGCICTYAALFGSFKLTYETWLAPIALFAIILACGYSPTGKLNGVVQNADIGTVQKVLLKAFAVEPSQRLLNS